MNKKIKWVYTFGVGTPYRGKYLMVETDDPDRTRESVYNAFGQNNISTVYIYDEENFANLVGKEKAAKYKYVTYGRDVIKRNNLQEVDKKQLSCADGRGEYCRNYKEVEYGTESGK